MKKTTNLRCLLLLPLFGILPLFGCKSPTSALSGGAPVVTIIPDNLQGVEFVIYNFKAKIENHNLDETYFIWNTGDDTASLRRDFNISLPKAYTKPGTYTVTVKAYDYYTDSMIAMASTLIYIDTAKSSVEIIPQFYNGSLGANTLGTLNHFLIDAKTSLPADQLYGFWDFGDGTTGSFVTGQFSHIFPHIGSYLLKLDVYQKSGIYVGTDTALITIKLPDITLDVFKKSLMVEAYLFVDSTNPVSSLLGDYQPLSIGELFVGSNITSSWYGNTFSIEYNNNSTQDFLITGTISTDGQTVSSVTIFARDSGSTSSYFDYSYSVKSMKLSVVTDNVTEFRLSGDELINNINNVQFAVNGRNPSRIGSSDSWQNFLTHSNTTGIPDVSQLVLAFVK